MAQDDVGPGPPAGQGSSPQGRWKLPMEQGHTAPWAGAAKEREPRSSSIILAQAFLCGNPGHAFPFSSHKLSAHPWMSRCGGCWGRFGLGSLGGQRTEERGRFVLIHHTCCSWYSCHSHSGSVGTGNGVAGDGSLVRCP